MNESHYTNDQIHKLYNYAHVRSLNQRFHKREAQIIRRTYRECFAILMLATAAILTTLSIVWNGL